jgi:hypothetical protein
MYVSTGDRENVYVRRNNVGIISNIIPENQFTDVVERLDREKRKVRRRITQ